MQSGNCISSNMFSSVIPLYSPIWVGGGGGGGVWDAISLFSKMHFYVLLLFLTTYSD